MSNVVAVSNLIATTMPEFWETQSVFAMMANRDYQNMWGTNNGMTTGKTFNFKLPTYAKVNMGLNTPIGDVEDTLIPYTVDENVDLYNVAFAFNVVNSMLELVGGNKSLTKIQKTRVVDNYAYPAFQSMSQTFEASLIGELNTSMFYCSVDSADKLTKMDGPAFVYKMKALMDHINMPTMDRWGCINSYDYASLSAGLQNFYNSPLNKNVLESAKIATGTTGSILADFGFHSSSLLDVHEAGEQYAINKDFKVDSVSADGSSITFKTVGATTTRLFKKGDVIWIPSVKYLRGVLKTPIEQGLSVVVKEDANGTGAAGKCTVKIGSPLVALGNNANVSAIPAVDAPAELAPNHRKSFFGCRPTISMCSLPLDDIYGANNSVSNVDYDATKFNVKVYQQGSVDGLTNKYVIAMLMPRLVVSRYGVLHLSAV